LLKNRKSRDCNYPAAGIKVMNNPVFQSEVLSQVIFNFSGISGFIFTLADKPVHSCFSYFWYKLRSIS